MAKMSSDLSLLIACRALFPFLTPDLLVDAETPIEGARKVRIGDVLRNLADQDKLFGLHMIDDIVREVLEQAEEEGYETRLLRGDLAQGRFATVGLLAVEVRAQSSELVEEEP